MPNDVGVGDEPLLADEGEEQYSTAQPQPEAPAQKINPYSKRGKMRYAFRILRGKDVNDILTADPAEQIRIYRAQQDNRWRGVYAVALLFGMLSQIWFANWLFWRLLVHNGYAVDSKIFIAFFASVVVEVIGLVLVVTKSLFPAAESDK